MVKDNDGLIFCFIGQNVNRQVFGPIQCTNVVAEKAGPHTVCSIADLVNSKKKASIAKTYRNILSLVEHLY